MGTTSTVTWHCEKCGVKGKLFYDELLTNARLHCNVIQAYGLSLSDTEKPDVFAHVQAVKFRVRRRQPRPEVRLLPFDAANS